MTTTSVPPCFGIIPARYASTRFPGKPLANILGKPMFQHVYDRAIQCPELRRVILATDDKRIFNKAESLNIPVIMTRKTHASGTDRVLEAAQTLAVSHDAIVINIQGDEPLLEPAMLSTLLLPILNGQAEVSTLARRIDLKAAQNPDQVKVVLAKDGRALYFSRSPIPFPRGDVAPDYYGHIGLYAFRMKDLEQFVKLRPSLLEKTEKLEQLRLLENGIAIQVVITDFESVGVDRPEDIDTVTRMLSPTDTNSPDQ